MRLVALLLLCAGFCGFSAQADTIDPATAARYFQEAKWASDDDGGTVWGKALYGPMIFADPQTRRVVANQPDKAGLLKPEGSVWVGQLPSEVAIANTATDWNGTRWTMVMWDALGGPSALRLMLMMHECWHRIQTEIGLPPIQESNAQLDTKEGRIWLRLEWRSLARALLADGNERASAIKDALSFRAYRQHLFPNSKAQEDRMELHEGMAEYTGVRSMGLGSFSRGAYMAGRLKIDETNRPSYPLAFAYETGPAYGILLDATGKPWRTGLSPSSSLSDLLTGFSALTLPSDLARFATSRAIEYGGKQLQAEETAREVKRKADELKWRALLLKGPILTLPLPTQNFTYDPNQLVILGPDGTVFPESHLADAWGVLDVTNGVRLSPDRKTAYVAAPQTPQTLKNKNWTLQLNPGWKLVRGSRPGDYTVSQN